MSENSMGQWLAHRRLAVDDIASYPEWRIGLSCAASWSWGVSIAVAIAVLHGKGLVPFVAWVSGNILSLPLFGVVRKYLPASDYWLRCTPIVCLFLIVEYFAVVLNLQAIRSVLAGDLELTTYRFVSAECATAVGLGTGLLIVAGIHRWGLRGSVLTDFGQYGLQLFATVVLAALCVALGEYREIPLNTDGGRDWMLTGFFGIITGSLGTGHQWQRFMSSGREKALAIGLWGGAFFGIYMSCVCVAGLFFTSSPVIGVVFMIIVFAVGTSTIDSSVAGLQFVARRLNIHWAFGSVVALIAVLTWPFVVSVGLTGIWTFMARIRYPIVLVAILLTLSHHLIGIPKNWPFLGRLRIVLSDRGGA